MRFISEQLYIIILTILCLSGIFFLWFFSKKNLPLKFVISLVFLLLFLTLAIAIKPKIYYPILSNPKISKEEKIKYIARSNVSKLGYNLSYYEVSIEKDGVNWLVKFMPKTTVSKERKISIWIDDNFKVIKKKINGIEK